MEPTWTAPRTATAIANGGYDALGNPGAANATSQATTANGQLAYASSTGIGSAGNVSSTATSNLGGTGFVTATNMTSANPNRVTVLSQANANTALFGLDSSNAQSYAFGTLLPTGTAVPSPGTVLLAAGAQGAGAEFAPGCGYSCPSYDPEYVTKLTFGINTAHVPLSGDLFLNIAGISAIGTGFDSLKFSVSEVMLGTDAQRHNDARHFRE